MDTPEVHDETETSVSVAIAAFSRGLESLRQRVEFLELQRDDLLATTKRAIEEHAAMRDQRDAAILVAENFRARFSDELEEDAAWERHRAIEEDTRKLLADKANASNPGTDDVLAQRKRESEEAIEARHQAQRGN